MLRITLAQLNLTVGDIEGNVQRMLAAAHQAAAEQADIVVFTELALCGYYPGDLLNEAPFLQRIETGLNALRTASAELPALHWAIGLPTSAQGPGKRLHNSLLVLQGGHERLHYAKQLLPTYGVFDERRHFEPGPDVAPVLCIGSTRIGFLICEDAWNDSASNTVSTYASNPWTHLAEAAPDVVISLNASPSHHGKREQRHQVLCAAATRHGLPTVYINQVGGHDQAVYDGGSFAVEPGAGVVFEAARFAEDLCTLQWDGTHFCQAQGQPLAPVAAQGMETSEFYRQQILLGLRDYARRCGFKRVLVGCSGGIDSALTLVLAVQALGADNVVGITMPSHYSSAGSVDDSVLLCKSLGITLHTHPIAELVAAYARQFEASFDQPLVGLALENVQSRIRGVVLMEYSNTHGHLLLTTGNKSEVAVGYCTLYGDTNGGLSLIGDLYKTEVFGLCRHLNQQAGRELIPQSIIDKPPSAELAPGQRDDDSLPPYPVLDEVLKLLIEGEHLAPAEHTTSTALVQQLQQDDAGRALLARVHRLVATSEYKRHQAAPILRLRAVAFGRGRQMPIAARYV